MRHGFIPMFMSLVKLMNGSTNEVYKPNTHVCSRVYVERYLKKN